MSYASSQLDLRRLTKSHNSFVIVWLPRLQKIRAEKTQGIKEILLIWETLILTYAKVFTLTLKDNSHFDELYQTYMNVQDQVRATFMAEGYIYIID